PTIRSGPIFATEEHRHDRSAGHYQAHPDPPSVAGHRPHRVRRHRRTRLAATHHRHRRARRHGPGGCSGADSSRHGHPGAGHPRRGRVDAYVRAVAGDVTAAARAGTAVVKPDVWMKSTTCDANACIEVSRVGDFVVIRGTEAPEWPTTVSVDEWATFVAGVKNGDF